MNKITEPPGGTANSRLIALIVACAMFMAQLDSSVVTLALPAISRSFGVAPVELTIGITVYLLAQIILLPTGGWIAGRFGARRVFATALAAFTVASGLCALSPSMGAFVAARALQGFAAAFMAPVGRIVLLESTSKRELVSAMTISTVPMLLAPALGPALGGLITTYWSWPWIFLLNLPFGIAGILLTLRFIGRSASTRDAPFDGIGFLLFSGSMSCELYALQRLGDEYPNCLGPGILALAGIFIGLFAVRHVRRHPHPIISLSAVAIPSFAIAAIRGGLLVRLPVRSLSFLLPIMFQVALGIDALKAGVLMLALNGGDLLLKMATSRSLRRFGFRAVLLATTALSAVSTASCALFTPSTPYALIFIALLVSGMFRSLLFTGLSTLAFADMPRTEFGSASTLLNLVQQGTNALGVSLSVIFLAISAQLAGEPPHHSTLHDFHVGLLAMSAIVLASLPSLRRLAHNAGAAVSGHRQEIKTDR